MTAGELCRVLIVDDEILIRQGIKHYMNWEQEGFEIVGEASNGQEALHLIERVNPHIIITDIIMPIMDGEELTKKVKAAYPKIEIIILSSFGEFDYVRSTFQNGVADYILKPKLDAKGLLAVLKSTAAKIPSFRLPSKNSGQQPSVSKIIGSFISGCPSHEDASFLSNYFPNRHYCFLGARVTNQPPNNRELELSSKERMENIILSRVSHAKLEVLQDEHQTVVYLLNINRKDRPTVKENIKQLSKSGDRVQFALTDIFHDVSQIGVKYQFLNKLLNYPFYFYPCTFLLEEELPKDKTCAPFNLELFTRDFKQERFETAFSYLKDYVSKLSDCYTTDVLEYKAFLENIIFNITILLNNMDYDVQKLERGKFTYFKWIDEAIYAKDAAEHLNRFLEEAVECIQRKQNHSVHPNIEKLLRYIEEHYSEPLTLSNVAKHFHFNPSYLSTYFTAHNKEGFIEYLNKIRIEEAAKLLIHYDASISEISGMVGFSDHSYFCKVFKKVTGLSPSQYRRKNIKISDVR